MDIANISFTIALQRLDSAWGAFTDRVLAGNVSIWAGSTGARPRCTRSASSTRTLTLHPRTGHEALVAARKHQKTAEFKVRYKTRSGVERTISEAAFALGARRARYWGLPKTHLQHIATAAAMNLKRVAAWLNGVPRSGTLVSHFARLAVAA